MESIIVNTPQKKYPIYFCKGFEALPDAIKKAGLMGRKICIISDSSVSSIYGQGVKKSLEDTVSQIYSYDFKAGEKSKNLSTIEEFYDFYLKNHFDRKTVIIALGGGVCGDMAGFSAATYLRGISFIQIPTTLLSQVDSSVGGKVGVDFKNTKNIIGAFYQPEFVYMNLDTLDTLPKREFSAGMAEVIKYGCIVSEDFYSYLIENKEKIKNMDEICLKEIIKKSCLFKAQVVSQDEKENGLREILNFGHTIGHAVESLMEFGLLHGECVGLGMIAALHICMKKNIVTKEQIQAFQELLEYFGLPCNVYGLKADQIYEQMFLDKKVKNNKISFVLLDKIGEAFCTTQISKNEMMYGISSIL